MARQFFQFILWQDSKKPENKREQLVTVLYWLIVSIFLLLFIVTILSFDISHFSQTILLAYIIPNLLCTGASRAIAIGKKSLSLEGWPFSGGQITIFFACIHVIVYLRRMREIENE